MNKIILDYAIITSGILGYFISTSLIITAFYKSRANNYLSLSLFLLTSLTFIDWYDPEYGVLAFINNVMLDLLTAVTLFTYFLIQIQHKYLRKSWYKWLYFPFFSSLIIETFFLLDASFNLCNSSFNEEFAIQVFYIKDNISFAYNVFLFFFGRILIKKSNTISEEKRCWLLRLNLFMICIIIIWFLSKIEFYVFDSQYTTSLLLIILSFLSWWILYYGVFKLQIVVQKDEIHQYLISKKTIATQKKKKINETTVSKVISQLHVLMDDEELYKNPLLSRLDLANRLEVSERYLSQIINQKTDKSVIQFVNEYRIEAAKNLLSNPLFNKYSIEAIGMEAGFKSKSAFYNAFNTGLGMSPGAFRKLQKMS